MFNSSFTTGRELLMGWMFGGWVGIGVVGVSEVGVLGSGRRCKGWRSMVGLL